MNAFEVGRQLVEMCNTNRFAEVVERFYAPEIVSVEPFAEPGHSPVSEGLEAAKAKQAWWFDNHEMHSFEALGPYPHGDRFAVLMTMTVTAKVGEYAGKRLNMQEVGLYTVRDGKIVREEFFYDMEM